MPVSPTSSVNSWVTVQTTCGCRSKASNCWGLDRLQAREVLKLSKKNPASRPRERQMLVSPQRPAQPLFSRAYHGDRVCSESSEECLPGTTTLNSHQRTRVLALTVPPWAACHAPHKQLIWKISEPIKIHPIASHQTCSGVNRPTAAQACGGADHTAPALGLAGCHLRTHGTEGSMGMGQGTRTLPGASGVRARHPAELAPKPPAGHGASASSSF